MDFSPPRSNNEEVSSPKNDRSNCPSFELSRVFNIFRTHCHPRQGGLRKGVTLIMIREVQPAEVPDLVDVLANAYPGWALSTADERERVAQAILKAQAGSLARKYFGLFRDGRLVGGMRLFDFRMNLLGHMVDAGGVGVVAVDLLRKKEHVAKELMAGFLDHYRQKNTSMALLYAFRTDFYQNMGFGLGPQAYRYKIAPARFPKGQSKSHIVRLQGSAADKARFKAYYHAQVARTHGLIEKTDGEIDVLFSSPERLVFGYHAEGELKGYMLARFEPENPENKLSNNLRVTEFFYDSPAVLAEFLTFLHSQADQLRYIVFDTFDRDFHHLFGDARSDGESTIHGVYQESNVAATGLMYRVLNTEQLFRDLEEHHFGGESLRIRLAIDDSFLSVNSRPIVVQFDHGRVASISPNGPYDVELSTTISHFSSLIMGTIPFRKLVAYGLATVSNQAFVSVIDRMFHTDEGPICTTEF